MPRCHRHYSDSANGPTYDQQLDAEQIQSLIDQRLKVLLGDAGSQHLDSCPQRPCLPVMLPTGMPTYGSQMPEAERMLSLIDQRIKDHLGAAGSQHALIPGYGGQPMSMPPPGAPSMPMQINGLLRPPTMGPPPTVPGGITPTSNAPPNPGVMHQGNPTVLATGAFDGYNISDAASGLQRPTQGVTKIQDRTMAGVTKIQDRMMTGGVTKKRKKNNGRSMEDRRDKQPSRADGNWHQKVAVEVLGVTTKWARKAGKESVGLFGAISWIARAQEKMQNVEANGPTYNQQLEVEQIQSLIDQRIKEHLGAARSQRVGAAFNQHLDSYPQRPCLPVMLPTGMPTYGSQMPEAEQIQSLITLIDQSIKDRLGGAGSQQAEIQQRLQVGLLMNVTLTTLPRVYRDQLKVVLLPLHVFLQMSEGLRTSLNMCEKQRS
ncbi:hypothetical protein MKW98_025013 [Papaver atlanticum]|uniref:Uncharacterized protein n=1 Tax=Papaver atlanticum TaxID=357466 RepID=A0AAD4T1W8_9MAGN|nr:hypothetical protein MKW98_025013 [Papaver atlanticum]